MTAPIDPYDDATAPDLGYPGMGYGAGEVPGVRLKTFDEMLPAARAFYCTKA